MQSALTKNIQVVGQGDSQCKKLKCDHSNKWYMHSRESVLENETHRVFFVFFLLFCDSSG